jgi:N-acetylneuraminate lyase
VNRLELNMPLRLTGLNAAAFTPVNTRGELQEEVIDQLAEHFVATGVSGVFVCGTPGECHSLSVEVRRQAMRCWRKAAGDRLKLVAHVGSNCLADSQALALDAADHGADAIASMAPFFFRPANVGELADYLAAIASAAPKTPFYYYDIPIMTGVVLPTDELLTLAESKLPTLHGVKFTRSDTMLLQSCLAAADGRFDILFGHDESLLTGLALGVHGAIGSTYNYLAPLYLKLIEAFDRGDLQTARQLQWQSVQLVQVLRKYGGIRTGKAIMSLSGIDCGPVLPPLQAMSDEEVASLRADLDRLDFMNIR